MKRRSFRLASVAFVAALLSGAVAVPAQAADSGADLKAEGCSPWLAWNGPIPTGTPLIAGTRSSGKVRYCMEKYKVKESLSQADYWYVRLNSEFDLTTKGKVFQKYPTGTIAVGSAPATMKVTSNVTATGNNYKATPSQTLTSSCGNISVSIAAGPVSVGTTFSGTCSNSVTRTAYSTTGAAWKVNDAADWNQADVAFSQAVPQGTVPKFTMTFVRPLYAYSVATSTATPPGSQGVTVKKYTSTSIPSSSRTYVKTF